MTGGLDRPARTWSTIARATFSQICAGFPIFLIGALAVYVREDIPFSPAILGAFGPVFLGARAVSGLWLGRVADRIGGAISITIALTVTAISCAGIALVAHDLRSLMAFLAVGGVAQALAQPAVNRHLSEVIARPLLGRALAVKQSGPPLTALFAGISVGLAATVADWRFVFGGAAICCLWIAMAIARESKRRRLLARRTQSDDNDPPPMAALSATPDERPNILPLAIAMALAYAGTTSVTLFYVDAAVTSGMAPTVAGAFLAIGSIVAIAVRLASGLWIDRGDRDALVGVRWLLGLGAVGYGLLVVGSPATWLLGLLLAFGGGWGYQSLLYYWVGRHYTDEVGRATGVLVFGGSLGGIAGPSLFGLLAHHASYPVAWGVTGAWLAVGAAGIWLVGRRKPD